MGSPTSVADDNPAGEDGRTGLSGSTEHGCGGWGVEAVHDDYSSPVPETVLRKMAKEILKETAGDLPILGERPWQGRAIVQRDLVERAARGDQEAFEGLVRLSANRLFAIAYRILRDHHLAEDAVQQTLVTIWDELPDCAIPSGSTPGAID